MSVDQAGRLGTSAGLARVTVSAPQRRVDVALPEHTPLAELLPEVLRHAGEGLADDGEKHGGWLLRRADGESLALAQGLFAQGVRDGEVLYLVPAHEQWPELEYDDVVEAIAEGARRHGTAWSGSTTRGATLAAAGVMLGVGLFALLRGGTSWGLAPIAGLVVALVLAIAGIVASRAYGDATAGAALGGYALPYAFAGGALLVAGDGTTGVLEPMRWLGAPQLLVGSVALLLVAVLGVVGIATGLRVFAAGVTVGAVAALAALCGYVLDPDGTAAILISVLVCGIGVLPLLAIRFGKLPMPPVALPTGSDAAAGFTGAATPGGALDAARERPDRTAVATSVARTEQLLTGMLIGHAVLCAGAVLVLVLTDGIAGRLLAAVASAALLLRSRLFVTTRQRLPLLLAGLIGFAMLGAALVWDSSSDALLALVAAGMVAALVVVTAGATYSHRQASPYLGRTADLLDTLVVISVIPVACAVLDLYARMRGLSG